MMAASHELLVTLFVMEKPNWCRVGVALAFTIVAVDETLKQVSPGPSRAPTRSGGSARFRLPVVRAGPDSTVPVVAAGLVLAVSLGKLASFTMLPHPL